MFVLFWGHVTHLCYRCNSFTGAVLSSRCWRLSVNLCLSSYKAMFKLIFSRPGSVHINHSVHYVEHIWINRRVLLECVSHKGTRRYSVFNIFCMDCWCPITVGFGVVGYLGKHITDHSCCFVVFVFHRIF